MNRELATLRRALRVAQTSGVIERVPEIALLPGERGREFVLTHVQEQIYLELASQPLKDVASLMLDTGLRVGEAVSLEWRDIHLNPVNGARYSYLRVREGESRNAEGDICLTARVKTMLNSRQAEAKSGWAFTNVDGSGPLSRSTVSHVHTGLRKSAGLPGEFVLHSSRHSFPTRMGEAGGDVF